MGSCAKGQLPYEVERGKTGADQYENVWLHLFCF